MSVILVASSCFELKRAESSPGRIFNITKTSGAHRDITIRVHVTTITRYFHIRQNLGNHVKMYIEGRGPQSPLLDCG
jgi:hypothetical protein